MASRIVWLVVPLLACGPQLRPLAVAPDNALEQGSAEVGPNQRTGELKVTEAEAKDFAVIVAPGEAPLCTTAGGRAVPGPRFAEMQALIAEWTKARAVRSPRAVAAPLKPSEMSLSGKRNNQETLITSPVDGVDPLNSLKSLALECSGEKPVVQVNGTTRTVDVVYGAINRYGEAANDTVKIPLNAFLLAGWNAASSELTVVRTRTGGRGPTTEIDVERFKHWNAAIVRNLQGFVPPNAMPITMHANMTYEENPQLQLIFPMKGMPIRADVLIVEAPVAGRSALESPAERLELSAVSKK